MNNSLERFQNCTRCSLGNFARNNPVLGKLTYAHVMGDGGYEFSHYQILESDDAEEVDIMFLGEAPGRVEDTRGMPFVGPSGRLLEEMVAAAMGMHNITDLSMYITNIVGCHPCDSPNGDNRPPTDGEIWACSERLQTEMSLASPRYVIFLGETAYQTGKKVFKSGKKMYHPAYILRQGGLSSAVALQFIRDLGEIIHVCNEEKGRTDHFDPTDGEYIAHAPEFTV